MPKTKRGTARGIIQTFLRQKVHEDFVGAWEKLRDEHHELTNIRARLTRAYAEHCARIDTEEQRATEADQREGTGKHVKGMWSTLGIKSRSQRSKIRATGRWYKTLPPNERDLIVPKLPGHREALYIATTVAAGELKRILSASSINADSTMAEFRSVLGKATPQDRKRNAKATSSSATVSHGKQNRPARPPYSVTVICKTLDAVNALVAYAESSALGYEVITEV